MQLRASFYSVFILAGALLSALLVFIAGNIYGPGFTYDSINYLYAGHSLVEKGKLLRPLAEAYIEWPPLYPFVIAAVEKLTGKALQGIFYLQILIAAITVWLAGRQAFQLIKQPLIFISAYLFCVFSTPVVLVNHFIWSESLFCLLVVVQFCLLIGYLTTNQSLVWYALLINGMLLCLHRHVGVFFIVGTVSVLWMYPKNTRLPVRIRQGFVCGFISLIPLLMWWLRNYKIKGQMLNDYSETLFVIPFFEHFLAYHQVFTAWFLPGELAVWLRILLIYACIGWLVSRYFTKLQHKVTSFRADFTNEKFLPASFSEDEKQKVLLVFFLSYFILTYAASFTVNEFLDDRILAPVYIPGMWLFFSMLSNYVLVLQNKLLKKLLIAACLLWTMYPVARTLYNVYNWHHQPVSIPASQPIEKEMRHIYKF